MKRFPCVNATFHGSIWLAYPRRGSFVGLFALVLRVVIVGGWLVGDGWRLRRLPGVDRLLLDGALLGLAGRHNGARVIVVDGAEGDASRPAVLLKPIQVPGNRDMWQHRSVRAHSLSFVKWKPLSKVHRHNFLNTNVLNGGPHHLHCRYEDDGDPMKPLELSHSRCRCHYQEPWHVTRNGWLDIYKIQSWTMKKSCWTVRISG